MATTTTSVFADSVATAYQKDYLSTFIKNRVWFDMVDWLDPIGGDMKGATLQSPVIEALAPATTALTDGTDVTPETMADSALSLTAYEYGNAVQTTKMLSTVAYTDVHKGAAMAVGQNQARSLDLVIREAAVAGTLVEYGGAATSRLTLDASADVITYDFMVRLAGLAAGLNIPPFDDGTYAAIVHPLTYAAIQGLTEWKAVGEYSDPKLIYLGRSNAGTGWRFKGEMGQIAGIRIIQHPYGKLFLSGGTPLQAATDVDGATAAGDTTLNVTSASGITVGNYITVGTLESATAEQVLVTAVSTNELTVRGAGNAIGNFGMKYAHADGVAVTEAPNVGAIPVFGPSSIRGRFASDPGKNGRSGQNYANTPIPERKLNHYWYWIGGFGIVDKFVLRGEVALTSGIYGDNK